MPYSCEYPFATSLAFNFVGFPSASCLTTICHLHPTRSIPSSNGTLEFISNELAFACHGYVIVSTNVIQNCNAHWHTMIFELLHEDKIRDIRLCYVLQNYVESKPSSAQLKSQIDEASDKLVLHVTHLGCFVNHADSGNQQRCVRYPTYLGAFLTECLHALENCEGREEKRDAVRRLCVNSPLHKRALGKRALGFRISWRPMPAHRGGPF
jgi:hypothetical protein